MGFTRMDRGTREEWTAVVQATRASQSHTPQRIKAMLRALEGQTDGHDVNQLEHALQTATRALRAGASDDLVVTALCHDIGTAISVENHAAIGAEILRPFVSHDAYSIVFTHQDFQRQHYHEDFGKDADARLQHAGQLWYAAACRFSDEWDQMSFDSSYDHLPLEHFEPLIDRVFLQPRRDGATPRRLAVSGWKRLRRLVGRRAPAAG